MKAGSSEKRSITPEQTIKALRENNIEVSENEAKEILDFLYFLAKLTVNQYINNVGDVSKQSVD
jgi:protein-tyrosine-phosphatase